MLLRIIIPFLAALITFTACDSFLKSHSDEVYFQTPHDMVNDTEEKITDACDVNYCSSKPYKDLFEHDEYSFILRNSYGRILFEPESIRLLLSWSEMHSFTVNSGIS